MKIVIVGGGIGGLATALACANVGHKIVVLERRPEFTEFGAGIQLAPNAFNALDYLGVGKAVRSLAVQIDELRLMDGIDGGVIARLSLGEGYQDQFSNPYMVVHRTDLYNPLLEACRANPSIDLHTSCHVKRYAHDADGVSVKIHNGKQVTADAVVAADGIRSSIREQLIGDGDPRVSGHTIYRSVIPMKDVPEHLRWNAVTLWAGNKWHFVHYPIAGGEYMNLAATRDDQAKAAVSGESATHDHVLKEFPKLSGDALALLSLGNNWKKWVLCDRTPVDNWIDNRVALLGDAAHPMLQYAAQGACMALEDAVVLAELLEGASSEQVNAKFLEYNQLRCDRVAKVVNVARDMGESVYHVQGEQAKERNMFFSSLSVTGMYEKIDWLHGMSSPFIEPAPADAMSA